MKPVIEEKEVFRVLKKLGLLIIPVIYFSTFHCADNATKPEEFLKISGMVFESDSSAASHILIKFIPSDAVALPWHEIEYDSVYTDSLGRYTVERLMSGLYNASGTGTGGLFYRKDITIVNGDTPGDTVKDTLRQSGTCVFTIKHRYHNNSSGIVVTLPGTGRYLRTEDPQGVFCATNLAQGIYTIRILSTIANYIPFDTTITVRTGKSDTLKGTIILEYSGFPVADGLTAAYDSSSRSVKLSWNGLDMSLLDGYVVYRALPGQEYQLLTYFPRNDTFYVDSGVSLWKTYHYGVAVVKDGEKGPICSPVPVKIIYKPVGWYRGQLHCHTTNSDGDLPPEIVCMMYRSEAYDFIAISDHNIVSETQQFSSSAFLTIPNCELTFGIKHVNAINAQKQFSGTLTEPFLLQDVLGAAVSIGAIAQINHPIYSEHTVSDVVNANGAVLLEVINHRHDNPVVSVAFWDSVLSQGRFIYGTAGDDCHNYSYEFNFGWVMVRADSLLKADILTALSNGDFYASAGPVITNITRQQRTLRVESIDGIRIEFIGKNGIIVATVDSCSAQYTLLPDEQYVRAQVVNSDGKRSYTQPFVPGHPDTAGRLIDMAEHREKTR